MAYSQFQPTSVLTLLNNTLTQEQKDAQGLSFQNEQVRSLTYGPNPNELSAEIPFNQGTGIYDVFLLQQISADILLMYGSFYSQMYRKTGDLNRSRNIPRAVKDRLLKENFPVHKIRNR